MRNLSGTAEDICFRLNFEAKAFCFYGMRNSH